jgi:1-acyl-sn-glycerol-3-phosphate acyltransferase
MAILVFIRKIYRLTISLLWLPVVMIPALWKHLFSGTYWKKVYRLSFCVNRWARGLARCMGLKIRVHGDPKEANGVLIVSNHCGYLDVMTQGAVFPIRFAPKQEIRWWPFLGWYLGLSLPVWVDRQSPQQSVKVMEACRETLKNGINMLVYPEGTSTSGEEGLLPFKSTAFEAVCGQDIAILPVLLIYRKTPDGFPLPWFGKMKLFPHYWHIIGYRRQEVEVFILPKVIPGERNRKELALYMHELMEKKYKELKENINKEQANEH